MAKFTKKTKIVIVTAALVVGASGTAFAYWTSWVQAPGERPREPPFR